MISEPTSMNSICFAVTGDHSEPVDQNNFQADRHQRHESRTEERSKHTAETAYDDGEQDEEGLQDIEGFRRFDGAEPDMEDNRTTHTDIER